MGATVILLATILDMVIITHGIRMRIPLKRTPRITSRRVGTHRLSGYVMTDVDSDQSSGPITAGWAAYDGRVLGAAPNGAPPLACHSTSAAETTGQRPEIS